jgi:large subunit ribosomal protein L21e
MSLFTKYGHGDKKDDTPHPKEVRYKLRKDFCNIKMKGRKMIREKGKIRLSRYFQNLKNGDRVCLVEEASVKYNFPERVIGRTGVISGRRGKAYIVKLKDYNQSKEYIVNAINLKKLK